jgi:hypothetical protein
LWAGNFFPPSILWCSHSDEHPQGELAKFGYYRSEAKLFEKMKEFFYILATCQNLLSKHDNPRKKFLRSLLMLAHFFSQKSFLLDCFPQAPR